MRSRVYYLRLLPRLRFIKRDATSVIRFVFAFVCLRERVDNVP